MALFNIFPYTNFHDLNMDWIINKIKDILKTAVFTVNNTKPDENGNVNLSQVSGMTSVNGIGADGAGNVAIKTSVPTYYTDNVPTTSNFTGTLSYEGNATTAHIKGFVTPSATPAFDDNLIDPDHLPTAKPIWATRFLAWDGLNNLYELAIDTTGQIKFKNNRPEAGTQIYVDITYGVSLNALPIVAQ